MSPERLNFEKAQEEAIEIKKRAKTKALKEIGFEEKESEEIAKDEKDDSYITARHYQMSSNEYDKEAENKIIEKQRMGSREVEDAKERAEIEKRKRKLPEIGKILESEHLDLGEKGSFIFRYRGGVIGIIKNHDLLREAEKIIHKTAEKINELKKKRSDIEYKHWRQPSVEADVLVVGHARNGKSILCETQRIKNVDRLQAELDKLTDRLDRANKEEVEWQKELKKREEKLEKAKKRALELIRLITEKLNLKVNDDTFTKEFRLHGVGFKKEERIAKKYKKEEPSTLFQQANMYNEGGIPDFFIEAIPEDGISLSRLRDKIKESIEMKKGDEENEQIKWVLNDLIDRVISDNFIEIKWKVSQQDLLKEKGDAEVEEEEVETYVLQNGTIPSWAKEN